MLCATLNEAIPLRMLTVDGRTDLFAQIRIYSAAGIEVSALSALHLQEGLYTVDWTPTIEGYYTMVGEFYLDSMFMVSAGYEKVAETIEVNSLKLNVLRLLGLQHENAVVDLQVYDVNGNLSTSRVRIYDSKSTALAGSDTGVIATYSIVASYDGAGQLTSYRMVRDS